MSLRADNLAESFKRKAKRHFLRCRVAAIAANSEFTADRLASIGAVPRPAIGVVYNGIDTRAHAGPIDRRDQTVVLVACVSRLVTSKRVHLMLDALAITNDRSIEVMVLGYQLRRSKNAPSGWGSRAASSFSRVP